LGEQDSALRVEEERIKGSSLDRISVGIESQTTKKLNKEVS